MSFEVDVDILKELGMNYTAVFVVLQFVSLVTDTLIETHECSIAEYCFEQPLECVWICAKLDGQTVLCLPDKGPINIYARGEWNIFT